MAQNFCTKCGAPLSESQSFCTKCGAPVIAVGQTTDNVTKPMTHNPTRRVDPRLDGFDTPAAGDWETPPEQPTRYDAPPTYREPAAYREQVVPPVTPGYPPEPPRKMNPIVIAIIAGLVIILCAVGFTLLQKPEPLPEPSQTASSQSAPSSSSSESEPSSSSSEPEPEPQPTSSSSESPSSSSSQDSDEQLYEELVDIYDTMGTQADRIKDVATTLNNTIFTSDKQARQNASRAAHDLFDEVDSQLARLKTLRSDSSSTRYASDIDTLIDLQQDLYNRIDVMCQAWDISLSYSNPKDHEAAIKKPLGKDNDSNGVNIYKKDFESRYPGARPTR